jgi:hypothetical protein
VTTIRKYLSAGMLVLLGAAPAMARSLRDDLAAASQTVGISGGASAFDAVASVLADTAARSLPVVSASAGFTYRFNSDLDIFERTSETLGPIFLERPDTLGRSKFNINVSFEYVKFDAFDGNSLSKLEAPDPIVTQVVNGNGNLLGAMASRLRYDINLRNYITAFSFTYGILDNLDVNLLLPLIETDLDVGVLSQEQFSAQATGPRTLGPFVPTPGVPATGETSGSKFGVGDLLLRFKYQLPRYGALRSAAGLVLRLPSGNENDFQGTGSFEASPSLYASTVFLKRFEPQVNVAIDLNANDVSRSEARWGVGIDVDLIERVGLAFAFLGRDEFARSDTPGQTDFPHLVNGTPQERPLLGLDFARKDFVDFSFGLRAVVWRNIMVFVDGIVAVNDQGLRNQTIIPTLGVEGTF